MHTCYRSHEEWTKKFIHSRNRGWIQVSCMQIATTIQEIDDGYKSLACRLPWPFSGCCMQIATTTIHCKYIERGCHSGFIYCREDVHVKSCREEVYNVGMFKLILSQGEKGCYVLVLTSSCRRVLGYNIPCRRHIHSTNKTQVKSKFKYFKK